VTVRCLIVDDSKEFLASAAMLLESQGIEIVGSATSTIGALHLAETLRPDLALVDIELGEEDGIELAQILEEHVPATRVVLISGYDRDELQELLAENPAIGYLPKSSLGVATISGFLR
jgi:two-component system, NarL family, nitrate/nitrite response regulator NarL